MSGLTLIERLERRTVVMGDCLVWQGKASGKGYGGIRVRQADGGWGWDTVHAAAYKELVGPVPTGMQLDHVKSRGCASRRCWNVHHLEPVTCGENVRRSKADVCPQGHAYDLVLTGGGRGDARGCSACRRESNRQWRARQARDRQEA
jgi:hypothetical protein